MEAEGPQIHPQLHYNWKNLYLSPLAPSELEQALHIILRSICGETSGLPNCFSVELALVDDAEIADLNQSYLGCVGPTNILSFPASYAALPIAAPQSEETELVVPLGWMALSLQSLQREVKLYGQDIAKHTLHLLAHGAAHLAGYEHGPQMDVISSRAAQKAFTALTEKS